MEKKSWKKKLFTNLIVFLVVAVVLILSFFNGDNQRKQWIEDYGIESNYFNQQLLNKGYITDSMADVMLETADTNKARENAPMGSETKVQEQLTETTAKSEAETSFSESECVQNSDLAEPQVDHSSAVSPGSRYIAETYGVNESITAGGLYPSKEIRIRELSTNQILWSMMGYYTCSFLWTSDSRYLAVSYTARTYGETVIVDTKDFTQVMIPIPEQIEENMQEFRPDVYLHSKEWMEDRKLLINYRYTGKDSEEYSGSYIYDLPAGTISTFQINDSITDISPIDLTQVDLTHVKQGGTFSATYINGSDTLDELLQNAEVIVKGTAGKVISDKPMGVLRSFHIENMVKGDMINDNELKLIQLKDGNELVEDEIYVLALENDYEEDTYHILGGYQGIFSIYNNDIYCKENKYQEELKQIMRSDDGTSISPLDKLCNSFSGRINNPMQME